MSIIIIDVLFISTLCCIAKGVARCFPEVVKWVTFGFPGRRGVRVKIFWNMYGHNKEIGEPGGQSTPKTNPDESTPLIKTRPTCHHDKYTLCYLPRICWQRQDNGNYRYHKCQRLYRKIKNSQNNGKFWCTEQFFKQSLWYELRYYLNNTKKIEYLRVVSIWHEAEEKELTTGQQHPLWVRHFIGCDYRSAIFVPRDHRWWVALGFAVQDHWVVLSDVLVLWVFDDSRYSTCVRLIFAQATKNNQGQAR